MIGVKLNSATNINNFLDVAKTKFFDFIFVVDDFSNIDFLVTDDENFENPSIKIVYFGRDISSFAELQDYVAFTPRVDKEYVDSCDSLLDDADTLLESLVADSPVEEGDLTLGEETHEEHPFDTLGDMNGFLQDVLEDTVAVPIGVDSNNDEYAFEGVNTDSTIDYAKLEEISDALVNQYNKNNQGENDFIVTPESEIKAENAINDTVSAALKGLFTENVAFEEITNNTQKAVEETLREPTPISGGLTVEDLFDSLEEPLFERQVNENRTQQILSGFNESVQTRPVADYSAEEHQFESIFQTEKSTRVDTLREESFVNDAMQSVKNAQAQEISQQSQILNTQSLYVKQGSSPYEVQSGKVSNSLAVPTAPILGNNRISACFKVPAIQVAQPKNQSRQLRGKRQSQSSRRKVIIVGGAGYNSFSTTVAINLAFDYRRYYNQNALLIDLDCVSGGTTHVLNLDSRVQCSIANLFTHDFKFYCNKLANFVATSNVSGISLDVITACFLDYINPVDRELIENYDFSSALLNFIEYSNYETIIVDIGSVDRLTNMQQTLLKNNNFLSLLCANAENQQVLQGQLKTLGEIYGDYAVIFTKAPNALNTPRLSQQIGRNVIGQVTNYPTPNVDLPIYSNMNNTPVYNEWYAILKTLLGVREY